MKYTTDKDLESSSNILACKALAQCNQRNANDSNSLLLSRKGKNLLEFEKNRKKQKKQPTIQPDTKGQVIVGNNELLEHIELLKSQLENAGIRPISEITSYEDGKSQLRSALEAVIKEDSFLNLKEVEKWDEFIKNHPQFIKEQKEENKIWEANAQVAAEKARNEQKKYIPEDIFKNASIINLNNYGVSKNLATRIMRNRALWLVRMDKKDVANVHIADLKFKYSFTGLDIIELRALYSCLPDKFDNDPNNEKEDWKNSLIQSLKDLENKEKNNTLPKRLIRNSAYCVMKPPAPTPAMPFVKPVSGKDLFSQIRSRKID
tara:strand:+ start:1670 stop:2626 length:957 start_codon:yes stop_codon:yes gene_type:complete